MQVINGRDMTAKVYQRAERKCKELAFTAGEDKKNQYRMTDLASKLQSKIKVYKKQIEEAEEIAALNLASSGRPSRSWRRLRSAPGLPRLRSGSKSKTSDNAHDLQITEFVQILSKVLDMARASTVNLLMNFSSVPILHFPFLA